MSGAWRIGRGLRLHRRRRGVSIREMARLADVSHVYLTAVEAGDRFPSAAWLIRFCASAGIDHSSMHGIWMRDAQDRALREWLDADIAHAQTAPAEVSS